MFSKVKSYFSKPKKEPATVENLFDVALEEIFKHLSGNDLKSAALVCKRWNHVIGSSVLTMRKFKLNFDKSFTEDSIENFISTRKHQSLMINFCSADVPFDSFNLSQVKTFMWNHLTFTINAEICAKALGQMTILENLTLFYENLAESAISTFEVIKLPRLEKFIFLAEDSRLVDLLEAKNLKQLYCCECLDVEPILRLLQRCEKLQTLALDTNILKKLFDTSDLSNMKFQLIEINIVECFETETVDLGVNLCKFLSSQASSLRRLRYKSFARILSPQYHQQEVFFTFNDQSNVKPLLLLKDLSIYFHRDSSEASRRLLAACPNIERLEIHSQINVLNAVARFNKNLIELSVRSIDCVLEGDVIFNNLRSLKISGTSNGDHFLQFIKKCPKIETIQIVVSAIDPFTDDFINNLVQHPTLKHLKIFGRNRDQLKEASAKIFKDYGALETLELYLIRGFDKKVRWCKFEFPDDAATAWKNYLPLIHFSIFTFLLF